MRIPIVDENDNIIEHREKNDRDFDAIYRVSALWIRNSKEEILLARRAWTKTHDSGKWGPVAAGTVEEGETYESNIIKEAEEELGLKNIKPILGVKRREKTKWNYFSQRFHLLLDKDISEFKIQKNEVAEVKWFSKEELRNEVVQHPEDFLTGIKNYVKEKNENQS